MKYCYLLLFISINSYVIDTNEIEYNGYQNSTLQCSNFSANQALNINFKEKEKYNLLIEVEKVEHIYGYVGDYVNHWYQIGNELYDTWQKVNLTVYQDDRIELISTSCDCNEKYVDRDDKTKVIDITKLEIGTYRFQVTMNLSENNGKYAGHTAKYIFHYKIVLS